MFAPSAVRCVRTRSRARSLLCRVCLLLKFLRSGSAISAHLFWSIFLIEILIGGGGQVCSSSQVQAIIYETNKPNDGGLIELWAHRGGNAHQLHFFNLFLIMESAKRQHKSRARRINLLPNYFRNACAVCWLWCAAAKEDMKWEHRVTNLPLKFSAPKTVTGKAAWNGWNVVENETLICLFHFLFCFSCEH